MTTGNNEAYSTPTRNRFAGFSSFGSTTSTTQEAPRNRAPFSPKRLSRYFSRRRESEVKEHLLLISPGADEKFVGIYSPVAVMWGIIFLIVPAAYLYIVMVLLRELCRTFPETVFEPIQHFAPWLAATVTAMNQVSRWVEIWCCLEAVFYIGLKLHIRWLQTRDPLEASLSAAPMMDLHDRQVLWNRMMECEDADPVTFLQGWFFNESLENIGRYDIRDFVAWSMFEGRHQEHLTVAELRQLEEFVEEAEHRVSLHLYGEAVDEDLADEDALLLDIAATGIFAKKPKKCEYL